VSNEMLKDCPEIIFNLLFKFMNLCLEKSLIPNSWSNDLISLLHKDGSKFDPSNYRGICVSSALLKVLCLLLNHRVQTHCSEQGLIDKNQIGFQKNCRTSDHLLTLKALVKKYVTIGQKKLFVCFVDFKKAFDSVWHKGLFHKMEKAGITGNSLNLIKDLYNKTKCAIKVSDRITNFFNYTKGVRQGCPLSPILFNLYVNDLFEKINQGTLKDVFLNPNNKVNALMYADDLVLISETKEGLQQHIDNLQEYCQKWKLNVNIKKTKSMVFNRGNKLIKSSFYVGDTAIENVKSFKYLGFTISAKNCSFQNTIDDLCLKANRAIFSIKNKAKLSQLPSKLALKIFNSQVVPILLYGSEVWGPFMDYTFTTWDENKTERIHTQFLKQTLGCNFKTSNNMTRADTGSRPLITQIINRFINYSKSIQLKPSSICYDAFIFESNNATNPNFYKFLENFNLDINGLVQKLKKDINNIIQGTYDRFWKESIMASPKAISFNKFKRNISLEPHLILQTNNKHRIALSRFRLSNHSLMIEKGRHTRPKIDRDERKCYFCKIEIENEQHFIINCPLYNPQRKLLEVACRNHSKWYDDLNDEDKFIYIMLNENETIIRTLGKFIVESLALREKITTYFFI